MPSALIYSALTGYASDSSGRQVAAISTARTTSGGVQSVKPFIANPLKSTGQTFTLPVGHKFISVYVTHDCYVSWGSPATQLPSAPTDGFFCPGGQTTEIALDTYGGARAKTRAPFAVHVRLATIDRT